MGKGPPEGYRPKGSNRADAAGLTDHPAAIKKRPLQGRKSHVMILEGAGRARKLSRQAFPARPAFVEGHVTGR